MPANRLHDRYIDLLFQRAGLDNHPSPMMLDRLERAITDREDLEAYIDALLHRIECERYPSPELLNRTFRAIRVLAIADNALPEVDGDQAA